MNKKSLIVVIGTTIILSSLTGCGSPQPSAQNTKPQIQMDSSKSASNVLLSKAFQDELNGFTTIEQEAKKGNFKDATTIAAQLHDEFHVVILPPLKDKKGEAYAENIHGKYDELQDAVTNKNTLKISELIKVNRDNLNNVANILGVTIKQS